MLESKIQSGIIDYLNILEKQGRLFFHRSNNNPVYDPVGKKFRSLAKGQKKGFPDIVVLADKRFIGLEVKSEKGYQTKEQKEIEKSFLKQGFEYYVVRSIDDVKNVLGAYIAR